MNFLVYLYRYSYRGECEAQVKGFSNARYKKFNSEREATEFINEAETKNSHSFPNEPNSSTKKYVPTDVKTDGK